ncbi:unnamed protein product [Ambrosiozyma monospora]|uniref:NADH-cytochrome b5 reductase n=1 Tax=Ambrosiozyma monospora TaxID=43982 RepID=A0A9W7DHU5_AMBMO|nr:unnamed protein product [Ambrosiozyma monospora]
MSFLKKPQFAIPAVLVAGSAAYYYSTLSAATSAPAASSLKPAFKGEFTDFKLAKVKELSKDTKLFTFNFNSPDEPSGLTTASCILAKFVTPKGSNVVRPYTPISSPEQTGSFDLLIKHYEGGKFTSHIFGLKEGDTVAFKGPIVKWKWEANSYEDISLIGGGTGITPLYQLITEILKNKNDNTKINLLYGSKTPSDILLKPELDALAAKYPEQFKLTYFVDSKEGDKSFNGEVGFITKDVLQKNLSGPTEKSHVFVCGPPALYKAISGTKKGPTDQGEVSGVLAELGYDKTHVFKF